MWVGEGVGLAGPQGRGEEGGFGWWKSGDRRWFGWAVYLHDSTSEERLDLAEIDGEVTNPDGASRLRLRTFSRVAVAAESATGGEHARQGLAFICVRQGRAASWRDMGSGGRTALGHTAATVEMTPNGMFWIGKWLSAVHSIQDMVIRCCGNDRL